MAPESSAARARQGQNPLEEAEVTQLVTRSQEGDRNAFEMLYRKNVGRVYAICMRICADPHRAEELTQEAFIRAWSTIKSFGRESSFSSWLYRLAVNVVLVDMRALRRRNARITVTGDLAPYDRGFPARPCHLTLDLEQMIAALPPQARTILIQSRRPLPYRCRPRCIAWPWIAGPSKPASGLRRDSSSLRPLRPWRSIWDAPTG